MRSQKELNGKMRNILFNWLVEIHHKFKLKQRTLFLAQNILDRYLEKRVIKRKEFQLVGMACFLVASKFEDIYPPDTKELCYLCENAYTKEDILRVESDILCVFGFELIFTSCYDILEQFYFTMGIECLQI